MRSSNRELDPDAGFVALVTASLLATGLIMFMPEIFQSDWRSLLLRQELPQSAGQNLSTGFESAYDWTLGKEGGCSDHPADRGGRTYKGIIRSVARRHGYDDPCTMPESKIKEIYLKEYWEPAKCNQWSTAEMQLTCFDTVVNFGLGGWQMFSQQGSRRDGHRYPALPKDEREAARVIAQWRLEFRDFRVREAPDQKVFLRGWRNRDNDLLRKVGG